MLLGQIMPGMGWIPIMLFLIIGGNLVGLFGIRVGLAFAKSSLAFRTGITAAFVGVISPLFFALVVGDDLLSIGYIMLATPICPGLLAFALSFREPYEDKRLMD